MMRMPTAGVLYCLASAAGFGAMGIFGKLAYDEGATVGTLLSTRFVVAAAVLWLFLLCSGRARELRTLSRRDAGMCLALGAIGYGAQAGAYFAALDRLDASLLSLLLYTFRRWSRSRRSHSGGSGRRRKAAALLLGSAGLVLLLAGAAGDLDSVGAALGLTAALVYCAYILISEGVAGRVGPLAMSTLVCTGAATTLTLGALAGGDLDPGAVSATGFAWLGALALLSTVGAIALFFAGLRRVARRPHRSSRPSSRWSRSGCVPVFGESLGPGPAGRGRAGAPGGCWRSALRFARRSPVAVREAWSHDLSRSGKIALVAGPRAARAAASPSLWARPGATVYCTGRSTARATLGVRPPRDDRGDGRAGRPPPAATASRWRSTTSSRTRSRRWSARIDAAHGRLDMLVNDIWGGEQLSSGTRRCGSTTSRRACACCGWRSTRT